MTLGKNSKQLRHMLRNLGASLIEHESVTTTLAKAKRTQALVENLITKSKHYKESGQLDKLRTKLDAELYKPDVVIPKMLNELTDRYAKRNGGYTRIIKLEPRIGDNAPQAMLELVDSSTREMRFWYLARVVARLEQQGLPLDKLTEKNVRALLLYRKNGEQVFRDAVALCKERWYKDIKNETKPRMKSDKNGFHKTFTDYKVVPRESQ
ncbi:hypothetical protein KL905_001160 [Ogataea polymorpha]|uniref:Uncharacterized protein n=1 Tax=Ogataea polymorpha TaxID=460523 RepID=A0A1B7SL27_9ASCO|nr:uncharacterized protein OGAPODRAFT_75152 [Ogataea polymorpha]KAG7877894.1 hypothetical protein KL937_004407 [Ogataea polymorpha]KAG7896753.1 hypothetical protein KL908_000155 [Ogataea polymorpha]KAG7903444.1 hypothetical protein KL935_000976 [Ogataea polymorpha]KAG7911951.1 hypothetical protein KL906_000155 [Ogataea polymorpha]KAG7913477.1 hypothetical protein KL907_000422 [Ogataea polymorpha]